MTRDAYADRCEDLFALGGFREARKAAEAGLAELGPDPVLYRWLGLAHAAEDDDDHDADAEAAYEAGLAQWPDDLGLLVSYLELCLRADTWSYPGRAARVERLKERIAVLAPAGSPEAARVDAALGWAGRGYWQDVRRTGRRPRPTPMMSPKHWPGAVAGRPPTRKTCGPSRSRLPWSCWTAREGPRCGSSSATGRPRTPPPSCWPSPPTRRWC
ncbi:hypothetical protein [Streptomyces californicus]|uniref:hypothetical protein n=1 Tax=Streptomyces californicus TaxID=67351 RepID=UPI00296EC94E|nr:hypothetical protein [Streptomyces californicus]MDW4917223.1 hypothetical protein [Streptomyces californicus]